LLLLGYFMFNRYQLKRRIQEQEALLSVRNNIAKDLHDEIGSTLTSIKILSEVSEKNLHKDQVKTSSFLQKITEQSAAVQQGISDIVWSVKPENDKLENMVIRMREYVAQTLESKSIQTVINIDEQVLNKTLDMNQRRDFFLIFKEAVNNIAKYANASQVQVRLQKEKDNLRMTIADNGKGFDMAKETSSSGLKNMKARAIALKGNLDIFSGIGKGSELILTIPAT
jgi:two-component system, NarL family, sensor histidine kinase UhpB